MHLLHLDTELIFFGPNVGYIITMLYLDYLSLWPFPGLHVCGVFANPSNVLGENRWAYLRLLLIHA